MPKTLQQKQEIIKDLAKKMADQKSAVLIDFKGIDSVKFFELRDKLKQEECQLQVVKKTLLTKVLERAGQETIAQKINEIKGQIAIAFGFKDEVAPAKICYDFGKEHEEIKILGGIFNQNFTDSASVIVLAQLPSRQELLGRLVGSLQSPISGLVYVMKGNLNNLVRVLNEIKKVKK